MRFFIPHLKGDPSAAEKVWQGYDTPAPSGSRRVYSVTYFHGSESSLPQLDRRA
jgi:hypothetical protein